MAQPRLSRFVALGSLVAACLVAVLVVSLLGAARAEAGVRTDLRQIQTLPINNPQDVTYDSWNRRGFVLSKGPPPAVLVYSIKGNGSWEPLGIIDLPLSSDPTFIDWDEHGDLVVGDDFHREYLFFDGDNGEFLGFEEYAIGAEFLNGLALSYIAGMLVSDFGTDSEPGQLWYGAHFGTELPFGDQIHPNGIDILPDFKKARRFNIVALILLIDAQNNDILKLSDKVTPQVISAVPGPPAASGADPPRDVVVFPLNLQPDDSKPAIHVVGVTDPSLGQVYLSEGPNVPWDPAFQKELGRPVRMDANCRQAAVTDFTNDAVRIFRLRKPRGAECEELVDVIATGGGGGAFRFALKPYYDGSAAAGMTFALPGHDADDAGAAGGLAHASARVRSRLKRLTVTAGHTKRFKLRFGGRAARRIAAALREYGHVRGTIKVRVKNGTGESTVVKRRIRLKLG